MDLKIAHADPARLYDRCELAALRPAESGEPYETGAAVPVNSWRSLPPDRLDALRPDPDTDARSQVELVALPADAAPVSFADLADALHAPRATYLGHHTSGPKLPTTTPNPANGLFVGVHVDNHDRLPYQARHLGRRRLCFNLGPANRYLLVADRDIRTIARAVHEDHRHRHPHTDDLRAYVARGRPINVIRVRLAPGEGYIAPTELVPHDGSTWDSAQPSTAAFWLGDWAERVLPWLV